MNSSPSRVNPFLGLPPQPPQPQSQNHHRHHYRRHSYSTTRAVTCSSALEDTISCSRTAAQDDIGTVSTTPFRVHNTISTGLMDYRKSWAWQHLLLNRRLAARRNGTTARVGGDLDDDDDDDEDVVLLFEHEPVYTLGRGADENHLTFLRPDDTERRQALSRKNRGGARLSIDRQRQSVPFARNNNQERTTWPDEMAVAQLARMASPTVLAPNGAPIYRVERGGEVTWHGPGQLVVYPLMDLKRRPFKDDLHWFLRQVEHIIIATLREYDIKGVRDEINTGVWVDGHKIAAVGVAASRWITTHGFALNVHPDLHYFDTSVIMPCGVEERGVTSLQRVLQARGETDIPTVAQVADVVLEKMEEVFGITRST